MANDKDLELIRERTNIVDLISAHTRLKKSGARYKGLCPFHTDKAPSFTVDAERKLWHCFGCGVGGDIFTFVMQTDNVDFAEAVRILAKRAGVELSEYRPGDGQKRKLKDRMLKVNEMASKYFSKALVSTRHGEKFLKYLDERRIPKEEIISFKLGASMDSWDSLIKTLAKKEISEFDLAAAGLAIQGEKGYYDRFRDRLMFPLFSVIGDVVGFAGRAYGDAMPKYLNTPESPLFEKGKMLYALDRAKKNVGEFGIIMTEGYMDVISLHKVGIRSAVASMGTALTPMQVDLLRRYCDKVTLCYDSDIAGDKASMRGIELLINRGIDIRVMSLPKGEDPDSIVRDGGPEAFITHARAASDYFDFFLGKRIEHVGADTPKQKYDVIIYMERLINASPNPILRDDQIRRMSERLGISERQVKTVLGQIREAERSNRPVDAAEPEKILSGSAKAEMIILKRDLRSTEDAEMIIKQLEPGDFEGNDTRAYFAYRKKYCAEHGGFSPEEFLKAVHPPEIMKMIATLLLMDDVVGTTQAILDSYILIRRAHQRDDLQKQTQSAQKSGDANLATQLAAQVRELKINKEKSDLIKQLEEARKKGNNNLIVKIEEQLEKVEHQSLEINLKKQVQLAIMNGDKKIETQLSMKLDLLKKYRSLTDQLKQAENNMDAIFNRHHVEELKSQISLLKKSIHAKE